MTAVIEGTRRARVLAHLEAHPGLTACELARVLGCRDLHDLLGDMRRKGQVVTGRQWRAQQGRYVALWYVAPPGTVPAPSAERAQHLRRLDREAQRRRRARARAAAETAARAAVVPVSCLPPGAACEGADPGLFFGTEEETPEERQAREAKAKAICARCPARRECYELARANGEPWGVWGGADFETENPTERTIMTEPEPQAVSAAEIDSEPSATAAEWLEAGPEDRHPYGFEPRDLASAGPDAYWEEAHAAFHYCAAEDAKIWAEPEAEL